MSSPYENLHDTLNEDALVFMAISDWETYQTFGLAPEDYYRELSAKLVRLAEAAYEMHGRAETPGIRLNEVATLGREQRILSPDEWAWCYDRLMDAPLGCLADPDKLKRHRRGRQMRDAHVRAARALEQGRVEEAEAYADEARQLAEQRLERDIHVLFADEFIEEWRREAESIATTGGISLGLPKLKSAVGPMFPGAVLVVGAQTGNGKSSLVLEMLVHAADDDTPSGLIAVEDPNLITGSRLVSAYSGIPSKLLCRGLELDRTDQACARISEFRRRLQFAQCLGGTEQDVMANMSVMARRGAKLIVVDYIGEVEASTRQQDRRNEVRWVMKRLKSHAARLGVALVIVSQLSRPRTEDLKKYVPSKHDLKEAGDLENAAEFIVLLWRHEENDFEPVNVKLAKSKNGGTGAQWLMQREVWTENAWGKRVVGSGRLREVVEDRKHPADRDFPLVERNYEAALADILR